MQNPELGARTVVRFATLDDREGIREFNRRLQAGGRVEAMPSADSLLEPLPADALREPVYKRLMIATDDDHVRAGMLLHHHMMSVRGTQQRFCWGIMPVSEGLINRAYALSILRVLKSASEYEPFLISLGVGSTKEPWARVLASCGWKCAPVPFFFLPIRTMRFLTLPYLQDRRTLKLAATFAAYTGAGAFVGGMLALDRRARMLNAGARAEPVPTFDEWADAIFSRSIPSYAVTAVRNANCLNLVYPSSDHRFVRLRIRSQRDGSDFGWIIVSVAQMEGSRHFGNLKIGVLVDGFGMPAAVSLLISAGIEYLSRNGVDLVLANWSHDSWRTASKRCGFLNAPSTYFLFWPKSKLRLLESEGLGGMHFTRGDSDGMVNLRGTRRAPSEPESR
jgi:hypothetical protein